MWQMITTAGVLTVLAGAATMFYKKNKRRVLQQAQNQKLAELSAAGFVFSKEYPIGSGVLFVDKNGKKWTFMDYNQPYLGKVYPFSAILDVHVVGHQKIYVGVRVPIGIGAIRQGATGNNTTESVTDSMRGIEVTVEGMDMPLFIDTMNSECSAERAEAIFQSLQERGRAPLQK